MAYITVFTATYNRAHCLNIPFKSLMNQTFKDFVWLIVDDGSTDNTEEVINNFIKIADFDILYYKTQNQGRAAAFNFAVSKITTEYFTALDSDDELTSNCLQLMHDSWESIPEKEKNKYCAVMGHCIDSITNKIIGGIWPENINYYSEKKRRKLIIKNKKGEKLSCRRTEIMKKYPFPKYKETKFVSESVVWGKMEQEYDVYCVNESFRIYHSDSPGSLSKGKDIKTKYTYYYLNLFNINDCFSQITYNRSVRLSILNISRLAIIIKRPYKQVMKEINKWYKRILVTLGYPFMWFFNKVYYK